MSQSVRASLAALVILGFLFGLSWIMNVRPDSALVLWLRWSAVFLIIVPGSVLIWARTIRDKAPDFLAKVNRRYFERDGFCYAVVIGSLKGGCHVVVYYQNRYSLPCEATVSLSPTKVAFRDVSELPSFKVKVACQGGEFGKAFRPWLPPARHQGKPATWDVAAQVDYSGGRGDLLRMRDGIRTAGLPEWVKVAGLAAGHLMYEKPARLTLKLPVVRSGQMDDQVDWQYETHWKLGDLIPS
jgi:hypothetical protein